jgi:uncharacterized membrane protein YbhN (UPF0104 family)
VIGLGFELGRRGALFAGAGLLVVLTAAATPQLLGDQVGEALSGLSAASPLPLALAGAAFALALVCSAFAWRSALAGCGRLGRGDAVARYGAGSLVNSLAPAHVGDAVRLALFAQAVDADRKLLRTGGALAGVGLMRCLITGLLALWVGLAAGLPVLPAAVLVALAATLLVPALLTHRLSPSVAGWVTGAAVARIAATWAVCATLGIDSPLAAALVIVPAVDLAGLMPLTPGNLGVKSGAIAVALQTQGVDMTTALTAGIALHAVETAVGLTVGAASALYLARESRRAPDPALEIL